MPISAPEAIDFPGFPTAVVRYRDQPMSQMHEAMDRAFGALGQAIEHGALRPAGPAFSRHEKAPGDTADFETGFPLDEPLGAVVTIGDVQIIPSELPGCRLAVTKYTGPYESLGDAWGEFMKRIAERGLTPGLPFWEAYDTVPGPDVDPATLVTGLAVPVTEG